MMQKVFEKSDIQQFLFENDNKGYVVTKGIGELFLFDLNTFEFHPCDLSGIYSMQCYDIDYPLQYPCVENNRAGYISNTNLMNRPLLYNLPKIL